MQQQKQPTSSQSSQSLESSLNRDPFKSNKTYGTKFDQEKDNFGKGMTDDQMFNSSFDDPIWNINSLKESKEELLKKVRSDPMFFVIDKSILCKIINYNTKYFTNGFNIEIVLPEVEEDLKEFLKEKMFGDDYEIQQDSSNQNNGPENTRNFLENLEKENLFTQEEEEVQEEEPAQIPSLDNEEEIQDEEEEEEMDESVEETAISHVKVSSRKETFNPKKRQEKIEKLKKIEKQKKTTPKKKVNVHSNLEIPRAPMEALIREIATRYSNQVRFEARAIDAIHELGESFLLDLFEATNQVTSVAKKMTIEVDHMKTAIDLSRKNLI